MALARFPTASVPPAPFPWTSTRPRSFRACLKSKPPSLEKSLLGLRNPPGTRRAAAPAAARCATTHSPAAGSDGGRDPLENLLKLYNAAKDGDVRQVSDVIGRTISTTGAREGDHRQPLETALKLFTIVKDGKVPFLASDSDGKKRLAMRLFSSLMGLAGNNLEFVIRPTKHEGTDVGIAWRLEWKKSHEHQSGGYGFHTVHLYQGKMFLRNMEKFVEPIVRVHLFSRKLMEDVRSSLHQINGFKRISGRAAFMLSLILLLLLMACSFMVVKKFPH